MARTRKIGIICLLLASTLVSGCYGKFALTKELYDWNSSIKDKYLRSGATWLLVLPYGATALLDFVIFNTIEFWDGKNPVAFGEKTMHFADQTGSYDIHAVKNNDQVTYDIKRTVNGMVETSNIKWDLATGTSIVKIDQQGTSHTYMAAKTADGNVKVTALQPGDEVAFAKQ